MVESSRVESNRVESNRLDPDEDVTQHVWRLLSPPPSKTAFDEAAAARAIASLGVAAVAPALGIYAGLVPEPDSDAPLDPESVPARPRVLLAALAAFPRVAVLDEIDRLLVVDEGVDMRLALVRLLGDLGGSGSLDRVLAIATELDPMQWQRAFVQEPIELALSRLLAQDMRVATDFVARMRYADPALAKIFAHALVRAGAYQMAAPLTQILGRDARLDACVVETIGEFGDVVSGTLSDAALGRMRLLLDHKDPRLVAAVANTLARLGDAESAPRLVDLLDHPDASRRAAAAAALRTLTGVSVGSNSAPWRGWLQREATWAVESLPELEKALEEPDAATIARVAAELRLHALYRHRAVALLLPALGAEDPVIAVFVCSVLPAFRSGASIAPLRALAEDGDSDLAAAARSAVEQMVAAIGALR